MAALSSAGWQSLETELARRAGISLPPLLRLLFSCLITRCGTEIVWENKGCLYPEHSDFLKTHINSCASLISQSEWEKRQTTHNGLICQPGCYWQAAGQRKKCNHTSWSTSQPIPVSCHAHSLCLSNLTATWGQRLQTSLIGELRPILHTGTSTLRVFSSIGESNSWLISPNINSLFPLP